MDETYKAYGEVERGHSEYGRGTGEDLKVFEKSWGHRVLMGLSVCMFVGGLILAIYCGMRVANIASIASVNANLALAYALYVVGLVAGIVVIPPAILGVYVATHPKLAIAAIVAGVVGLLCVLVFAIYSAAVGGQPFSIVLYCVVMALAPLIYLLSALKIKSSGAKAA